MRAADDPPIACTLSAALLPGRLALIRRVTRDSLLSHRLDGHTLRLAYRAVARAEVERLVAAERACCAFLRFELRTAGDVLELAIDAPAGIGLDARWLFDQFLPEDAHAQAARACACAPGARDRP
ncbi:MAG: hypothetical protein ACTHL8_10175 [Burkholderiaceae bacterium]